MRALFRRRSLVVVLVLVGLSFVGGCNKGPTNPSGGYDPSKPVGGDNWPPSPPAGTQNLTVTYDLTTGDCLATIYDCAGDVQPTDDPSLLKSGFDYLYILKNHTQLYTLRACITHAGWPGRRVDVQASAMHAPSGYIPVTDEGSLPHHVCVGDVFNLEIPGGITNDGFGHVSASEGGWDMRESIYVKKNIYFLSARR